MVRSDVKVLGEINDWLAQEDAIWRVTVGSCPFARLVELAV